MNTLESTNVRRKMWVFEGLKKEGEFGGVSEMDFKRSHFHED
jgi:hypothetical protein